MSWAEGGEDGVVPATIEVDVKCQRIGRRDGHQVFVEVEFKQPITQQEIILALKNHDWSQQLKHFAPAHHFGRYIWLMKSA